MRYLLTALCLLCASPAWAQVPTVVHVASSPKTHDGLRQVMVTLQRVGPPANDAAPARAVFRIPAAVVHTASADVVAAVLLTPAGDMDLFATEAQADLAAGNTIRIPRTWWRRTGLPDSGLDPRTRHLMKAILAELNPKLIALGQPAITEADIRANIRDQRNTAAR